MLQRLFIKDIVLIEECEICFSDTFNVLTGETGSGKSVILSAISFLMGERIDTSMIRKGKEVCSVDATFALKNIGPLREYLENVGIDHEPDGEITIHRKLTTQGKTKNFINNQSVQVSVLKTVVGYLLESCSQHAHLELLKPHTPTLYYDAYIDAAETRCAFQKALNEENRLKNEMTTLLQDEETRFRKISALQKQIEEIESLHLLEGEDEELFKDIESFYKQKETYDIISDILSAIDSEDHCALFKLKSLKGLFERLALQEQSFEDTRQAFMQTITSLNDVVFQLAKASSVQDLQDDIPKKERRLKQIDELKRTYGNTICDILTNKEQQAQQLYALEHVEETILGLKEKIAQAQHATNTLAEKLAKIRKDACVFFSEAMTKELRVLNLPNALFEVDILPQKRTELGDESIQFFLTPNQGEKRIDIQAHASGGELSRIALCLQKIVTHKNATPTLLFDEIDANVGGRTATHIAEKLVSIAQSKQIICVTHFPQVAKMANAHYRIAKYQKDDRTISTVECLTSKKAIQDELDRMFGTCSK